MDGKRDDSSRSWRDFEGPLAHWPRGWKRLVSTGVLLAALAAAIALEIHLNGAYFVVACDLNRLQAHGISRSSYLYSSDGVRFVTLGPPVVHTAVPLGRIDRKLQKATIAIEDRRYQFNLAVQGRRQAGSSFKLFVLTNASPPEEGRLDPAGGDEFRCLVSLYRPRIRSCAQEVREFVPDPTV